jgi:glycosyltransferase involved in cell wall biosynthesis
LACYRNADLFVLASQISADGDRDGLPNVLMEAASQRLACLSTNISGIPELIEHGKTGWLVAEKDSDALRRALLKLITEPGLRLSLAETGQAYVRKHFSLDGGIDVLAEKLGASVKPDIRS